MGYTTEFEGNLNIDEKMKKEHIEYVNLLSRTRRMKRDVNIIKALYPNWALMCLDGNLGTEGEFFCNPVSHGQVNDRSVIDYNRPPTTQPGLWCDWILKQDKDENVTLEWDGGEKFYDYVEWLDYLIVKILNPWGYHPYGVFLYAGEESDDAGYIIVEDNKIKCFDYREDKSKIINYIKDSRVIDMMNDIYRSPDDVVSNYWSWMEEE